jgi:hypothetical protein
MTAAALSLLIGAIGSIGFLWHAGQRTPPLVLTLMTLWVLAPFIGLFAACIAAKRWPQSLRRTVHVAAVAIALGSLVTYGTPALKPHDRPAAFLFVAVPFASWLLGITAIALGALISSSMKSRRF